MIDNLTFIYYKIYNKYYLLFICYSVVFSHILLYFDNKLAARSYDYGALWKKQIEVSLRRSQRLVRRSAPSHR